MAQRKGGLGRGLGALIQSQTDGGTTIQHIEVAAIEPNPYQPRESFEPLELEGLASSVREVGVLQPIIVSRHDGLVPFRILAGERRWRAARQAGLRSIPAIVRESSPREMLEIALIENVQRADLTVLEEASAYRQLIDDFGLTQAGVAERVGKSRVAITNALRVLNAPDEIKTALMTRQISEGHARALLGLELAVEQLAALQIVLAKELNVRQSEQLVRQWSDSGSRPKTLAAPRREPAQLRIEEAFRRALGTKVDLQRGRRGGRIVIHYFSDEELDGLYNRIIGDPDDL